MGKKKPKTFFARHVLPQIDPNPQKEEKTRSPWTFLKAFNLSIDNMLKWAVFVNSRLSVSTVSLCHLPFSLEFHDPLLPGELY